MSFPISDKYWKDTSDFIMQHAREEDTIVAPIEFRDLFGKRVIDYSPSSILDGGVHWAIIHKGMIKDIDHILIESIDKYLIPVYVNEVFVIFSNQKDLPEISCTSPHIKSYWEKIKKRRFGYLKKLKIKIVSTYKKLVIRKIKDKVTIIENKAHRECVYLGDYKALTRTIFGQKVFVDTRDMSMTPHILLDGYWEMWTTNIFMNLAKEGMHVIDIGANIGYYSLILASKIGSTGKLFAFEADPGIYDILHKNIEINGFSDRTELINKAVLDKNGTVQFNRLKQHHGSSSIANFSEEFLKEQRDIVEAINVETISLDEYFKNRNIKIDIIKIDAEGSEPFIFDGMKELIDKNPDMIVICEFNPGMIYGTKKDPRKFLEEIERIGFTLKYIDTNSNIVDISIGELLKKDVCELYLERMIK